MSVIDRLQGQLQASADGLLWALEQVPTGRLFVRPLPVFGEWSALQILAHITWQERHVLLSHLRPEPLPDFASDDFKAAHTAAVRAALTGQVDALITDFEQVHTEMLARLDGYTEADWQQTIPSPTWEGVSPYWVALKAYQHRLEHTDTILNMTLFWDMQLKAQGLIKD